MDLRKGILGILQLAGLGALAFAAAAAAQVTIPDFNVEATTAESGEMSLIVVPDGSGSGFDAAYRFATSSPTADATILMTLYNGDPFWGDLVANFPREDIWLACSNGHFAFCPGGTIADADTDANGQTSWRLPLHAGGWIDPSAGDELWICISGDMLDPHGLGGLRLNSPDLNFDLRVDLADVAAFASDYYGTYRYRSDFVWDGQLNIADVGRMANSIAAQCP